MTLLSRDDPYPPDNNIKDLQDGDYYGVRWNGGTITHITLHTANGDVVATAPVTLPVTAKSGDAINFTVNLNL